MNRYDSAVARPGRPILSHSQLGMTLGWYVDPTKLNKLSNALYHLSWMLSLTLLCLVFTNAASSAPGTVHVGKAEARTALKKGIDREAVLATLERHSESKSSRSW